MSRAWTTSAHRADDATRRAQAPGRSAAAGAVLAPMSDRAHPAGLRPPLHPAAARLGGPLGAVVRPRRARRRPARHQLDRLARRAVGRHPALPRAAAGGRHGRHRLGQPRPHRPRCARRAGGAVARRGARRRRADRRRLADCSATRWSRSARGGTARSAGPPSTRSSRPMPRRRPRALGLGLPLAAARLADVLDRPAPLRRCRSRRLDRASTSPTSCSPATSTSRRSSPTASWADRIGATWVFNAGRQIGPVPCHRRDRPGAGHGVVALDDGHARA